MSQSSPVVMIGGVKLNSEHVERELLKVKKYCISMDRIVLEENQLGHGGFGIVKRATLLPSDSETGTSVTVVVKELKIDGLKVIPLRAAYRLVREMFIWAKCEHENIVQFVGYHLGKNYDPAYLISPYMKNGNISEYIEKWRIGPRERLELVQDTIMGVDYLHTQDPVIVHGDLKAANVLVNDSYRAQLCDFGLSKAVQESQSHTGMTTDDLFAGSIRWCSPEAIEDEKKTCASDIWAWGCLVLEIMTGKIPYPDIERDSRVLWAVSKQKKTPEPDPVPHSLKGLLDLLRKCWELESKKRPDAEDCQCILDAEIWKADQSSRFRDRETSTVDSENKVFPTLPTRSTALPLVSRYTPSRTDEYNENDSVVGPGYRVNELPPELSGTLNVLTRKHTLGSFADVYRGKWMRRDGPPAIVAIKRVTLPEKNIPEEQFRTRIKRETVIWAMAKHPNILPFIGYQIDDRGVPMLVSPWCKNGNLATYIKNRPKFPRPGRVKLLYGAACGLMYLHTLVPPIVHGDIKPENIIIQGNLEAGLCDFGISKIVVVAGQHSGSVAPSGTHRSGSFLAPEVLLGEPATTASDVYAFGGVILLAMSGKAPFEGSFPAARTMIAEAGRTPHPSNHPLLPPTDRMWSVYEACSRRELEERLSMPALVSKLKEEMSDPGKSLGEQFQMVSALAKVLASSYLPVKRVD